MSRLATARRPYFICLRGETGRAYGVMELLAQASVTCPYCGEVYSTTVDTSQRSHETIEDCPVCCRPILLEIECEPGDLLSVEASPG